MGCFTFITVLDILIFLGIFFVGGLHCLINGGGGFIFMGKRGLLLC